MDTLAGRYFGGMEVSDGDDEEEEEEGGLSSVEELEQLEMQVPINFYTYLPLIIIISLSPA